MLEKAIYSLAIVGVIIVVVAGIFGFCWAKIKFETWKQNREG